jgi:hypothetical protein
MLGLCVCACDQAEAFEHRELSQCLVDLENLRYHSAEENFQLPNHELVDHLKIKLNCILLSF